MPKDRSDIHRHDNNRLYFPELVMVEWEHVSLVLATLHLKTHCNANILKLDLYEHDRPLSFL